VNEALPYLVVRDPAFYEAAQAGSELEIDLASGRIRDVASGLELQAEGRLVPAVKRHGKEVFARLSA
jgi:hypothetical protein